MKKIITAAGLVAVGVAGISDVHAQSKPWSIGASLRGFYDDNYATAPSSPPPGTISKRSSWGSEISPFASYNLSLEQTSLSLKYIFDMRYYEDRRKNSADYSHQFDAILNHQFSERYSLTAGESFAIAQEPGIIDPTGVTTNPLRTQGNNVRNVGNIRFNAQMTPIISTEITYQNTYYDYQESGFTGSRSALLDRDEHLAGANLRWQMNPTLVGLLGYQFGLVNQNGKDFLVGTTLPKARDSRSHYIFVGGDYNATSQLSLSARVGVQYIDYPNANTSSFNPYVDCSANYQYTKDSYIQLGVINRHAQTDIANPSVTGLPTLDQEATSVYATVKHQITGKLSCSLNAQFQNSQFNQGGANNQTEQLYTMGLSVNYQINPYLTADVGYNYDKLDSDLINRSFYRNRVYLGITATY